MIAIKIYLTYLVTMLLLSVSLIFVSPATPVYAQNRSSEAACDTLQVIDGSDSCKQGTGVSLNSGLKSALTLLSIIAGIIAVIMIMLAGLRFITSEGDSQKVSQAKNAMIYAAIGIVVVALAQLIVRFILGSVSTS